MYLINRRYAQFLINNFYSEDKIKNLKTHFASDWIVTKNGKRAFLYPMLAVEDGLNDCGHEGQNEFHKRCYEANFNKDLFI